MFRIYTPSGRIGGLFWLLAPVAVVIASSLMIVQRLLAGSGVAKIKVGIVYIILYAGVLGAVYAAVRLGRCRSSLAGGLLAVLVTLGCVTTAHATPWARDPSGRAAGTSLINWPAQRARDGLEFKVSRTRSFRLTGWEVWALWSTEAACILFLALGASAYAVQSPFCEACRRYASGEKRSFRVADPHEDYIAEIKQATSIEPMLLVRTRKDVKIDRDLEFERSSCGCAEMQLLKIEFIKYKKRTGRREVDERSDIRERLLLDPEEADAIDGMGDEIGWEKT